MKETYTVKFKRPGGLFWRKLKGVKGDAIEEAINLRWFLTEDDNLYYIPLFYEVVFSGERQAIITHKMSKESGQPIQRN